MRCASWAPVPAEDWVLAPMRGRAGGLHAGDMSKFAVQGPIRWVAVTVVVAAAAVPLSFVLWRTPAGVAAPPPDILPFLIAVAVVIPALSFGFGVGFLLFGGKMLRTDRPSALSRASFVSIWWLLANWWPHSNFHRVSSGWTNLVVIDYFFHATVIVASCIVAAFFLSVIRERREAGVVHSSTRDIASTPSA
jgi:hypothetical protein